MTQAIDLPSFEPRPQVAKDFKVAEVMLFTTCNFNCGYCGFVTTGAVKATEDMAPFKDRGYIDRVFQFFEKNSSDDQKWILHLSGGEPLLMPNLDYFARKFIGAGHKLAYNTNLSLPVEKSGWMDHNPPWGIDALVVSLHQEALDRFDKTHERVRILREQGYRICIRMVGHPLFIERFDELDDRFKEIDVSFNVNALYSPRYPAAYTDEERQKLTRHMKVNYEVIRMNGGLDATGKTCYAGSRMISLALGFSGGGRVYPCVNTSTPDREMGSIFENDIKLFSKPTPCLRADNCCSCAVHFTHKVVPWADDSEAQDAMLGGYTSGIADTWQQWFAERGIKVKQHASEPQGTLEGEQRLVIKKTPGSNRISLPEPDFLKRAREFLLPPISDWQPVLESTVSCENGGSDGTLVYESNPQKYGYLLLSPGIYLPHGNYSVDFQHQIELGGITVGICNKAVTCWIHSENYLSSGSGRLIHTVPIGGCTVRFVIAACNHFGEGVIRFTLKSFTLRRDPAMLAHYQNRLNKIRDSWRHRWRTTGTSFVSNRKTDLLQCRGRMIQGVEQLVGLRQLGSYEVVDSAEVGYAVRGIELIRSKNGHQYLLTADVGDDSVSAVPVINGRLQPRRCIQFPKQSTPMYISRLRTKNGYDQAILSFFNFDTTSQNHKKTYVAVIDDLEALIEKAEVHDIKRELSVMFERHGHWGFRGTCVEQEGDLSHRIAAIDRDADMFYLLTGTSLKGEVERLDIGVPTEPIGVAAVPTAGDPGGLAFYMSSRKSSDLVVVGRQSDGKLEVRQRYELGGRSRSSVAVGRMLNRESMAVAVALWGGDPTDINASGVGAFVVGELDGVGRIVREVRQQAGINPTDIAAGDFDGDGIDEVAVLNYGSGLGPGDRTNFGGVEIYKVHEGSFRRVAAIKLANPRIAGVVDIDGDGRDELVVSLFFERRVVVIKCL